VVAADALGVPLRFVNVRIGRSTLPEGPASGGSITAHNTAPAMVEAATNVRQKLLERIAEVEGADASEFDIRDGEILRRGRPHLMWPDACGRITGERIVGRGEWKGQESIRQDKTTGHSRGVQFADLDVDVETGVIRVNRIVAIQACGQVICRKTAESQIIGGVIQGLSYALFENKILDRNTAAMVNPNLEWYKIAGPMDMPHIQPVLWTKGQTGVRSLGEPPVIPTAGAIACAVFNAIGYPVRHLPLTPDKVRAAFEGGVS
jgi:xanthine dehydrogenase YagR molybdenum-binding subunit